MDKQKYIFGHPLLERERVRKLFIKKILEALAAEDSALVVSTKKAAQRMGCSHNQAVSIFRGRQQTLSIRTLVMCMDALCIKISFDELTR